MSLFKHLKDRFCALFMGGIPFLVVVMMVLPSYLPIPQTELDVNPNLEPNSAN